ncbi:MAG: DUF1772 domain-containing protein [Bacteroidetes bacterium]|nr:DUF1772 domain-containing protein [Bacteroidota bacterium]
MHDILVLVVLFVMGAQFGVALTATIVVHPILLLLKPSSAIEVFKPFFDKTHVIVLAMSIVVSLLALVVSIISGNWWWFIVTLFMHLNGPYTIFMMMPLNRRLMADEVDPESEQTKSDLKNWGYLHGVRTALNGAVFLALLNLALF